MATNAAVKEEPEDFAENQTPNTTFTPILVSSSDSDSGGTSCDESNGNGNINKKRRKMKTLEEIDGALLKKKPKQEEDVPQMEEPFSVVEAVPLLVAVAAPDVKAMQAIRRCKQFWKAGDYEGGKDIVESGSQSVGMDHVRIHPKFLHSNATSHKWALGAFAELLDNALDEVMNGANFVHINLLNNGKSASKMLLVEDNGGGMTPDKMRQCMSLGYSAKSKSANTIGQYGNGFKTSTMRLGADVIVFSRCAEGKERSASQSIGMLSYTFLTATGKEDIIVPMIDYEKSGQEWKKMMRSSLDDWQRNLEMILQWSPFESEDDLLQQFQLMQNQGTRVIIYNLWEDDEGKLELDFDTDPFDIQIRGVNRDEKKIRMAKQYPNSRHFLTYNHSLRSYASILYLRLPPDFRIILRGKDVEHHNLVNDMIYSQTVSYKPHHVNESTSNDSNMTAVVTVGFVKDAHFHIDVQGFNVYHKNRLIKPFWRVWNAAGSDGRGVIGVLEANFVEPAHDKQGFERTTVLSRLEARLITMQKNYWNSKCHLVGYSARGPAKKHLSSKKHASQFEQSKLSSQLMQNGHALNNIGSRNISNIDNDLRLIHVEKTNEDKSFSEAQSGSQDSLQDVAVDGKTSCINGALHPKDSITNGDVQQSISTGQSMVKMEEERNWLRERLREKAGPDAINLLHNLQFERERRRSLEKKLLEAEQKIKEMDKEQLILINLVVEERTKREQDEEKFRKQLMEASVTIDKLLEKLKWLQGTKLESVKLES